MSTIISSAYILKQEMQMHYILNDSNAQGLIRETLRYEETRDEAPS